MSKKLLLILIFCLLTPTAVFAINTSLPSFNNPFDDLQVKIPGMARFSEVTTSQNKGSVNLQVNWIGEYIMGLYNYAIAIIGIFAVVGIAIGGVIWLLSLGNPSRVMIGKDWIVSSILGLLLALGSYFILNTITPDLVKMKAVNISYIEKDSFDIDPLDYNTVPPTNAGSSHGVPIFFQNTAEGKSTPYGNCGPRGTIAYAGCGVVSTQMVLAFYGKTISLAELTKAAVANGARVCGSGSAPAGLVSTAQSYGLQARQISASEISAYLDGKQPVIVLLHGPCIFTQGGHYVVLTGWRDRAQNLVDVNDPANSRMNPDKTWTSLSTWSGCSLANALVYTQ